jgi:hypothetical protein
MVEIISPADWTPTKIDVLVSQLGGGGNLRAALFNWVAGGPATLVAQSAVIAAALGVRTLDFLSPLNLTKLSRYYLAIGTTSNGLQLAAFQSGSQIDGQSTAFAVRDLNNFVAGAFPASANIGSTYQFPPWMRLR